MASPVTRRASRLPSYSGTPGVRLWRAIAHLQFVALAVSFGFSAGGCALSYRLDSMLGKDRDRKSDITGTIPQGPFAASSISELMEGDLVYARAAAAEVLTRGGKDASAPWENPATGARGTVTPIATAYTQDGVTCRDFLASYVRAEAQAWLQGEACRMTAGRWEIRSLKPLQRS